jgi:hypothetical protein
MQTVEKATSSPNSTNAVLADGWIPVAEKIATRTRKSISSIWRPKYPYWHNGQ